MIAVFNCDSTFSVVADYSRQYDYSLNLSASIIFIFWHFLSVRLLLKLTVLGVLHSVVEPPSRFTFFGKLAFPQYMESSSPCFCLRSLIIYSVDTQLARYGNLTLVRRSKRIVNFLHVIHFYVDLAVLMSYLGP